MKKPEARTTAGVRELKARLSHYLGLVKEGRAVYVTERGKEVARLTPAPADKGAEAMWELVRKGIVHWNGEKPRVPAKPIRLHGRGKTASQTVIEMRRESLLRHVRSLKSLR